jgi:hypothetical protein
MKKLILMLLVILISQNFNLAYGEDISVSSSKKDKYSIEVSISGIPENQQTLYIPIELDSEVVDLDKVALDGVTGQNILPVAASSKDKVGPGIGLLKLDDKGLPETLKLKVFLKPVKDGATDFTVGKVAEDNVLPVKGAMIRDDVTVNIEGLSEVTVTETEKEGKKRLQLEDRQLTLNIEREEQKEETIFIPLLFDSKVVDVDESFGHSIVGPGISVKSFSAGSLHGEGSGVELVLSGAAEKDLSVTVDIIPKGVGLSNFIAAYPQEGRTKLIKGPVVEITPSTLNVALSDTVEIEEN